MRSLARFLTPVLALTLALPTQVYAQDASWPAAATAAHAEASAAYSAGDYSKALTGYQRAYAAMPDPIAQRNGRDAILGSLRSTYARLYEASRDRSQLCAWRATLVGHTEALRSRGASLADTQGLEGLKAQVDADVARDFPGDPHCVPPTPASAPTASPAPASTSPVTPAPTTTPAPTRPPAVMTVPHPQPAPASPSDPKAPDPRMWRAGGIMLGVGVIGLLGMATGLVVADNREKAILDLDRRIKDSGEPPTQIDIDLADRYRHQATTANTIAIAAGITGGVFVVTGAILMIVGRKSRRAAVAPQAGGVWGLAIRGQF